MEVLDEVLIKECGSMIHDKVFIVENLPKKFLFQKTVKMVPRRDKEGYMDGTVVPDPKGEMVDTLYPGIDFSPTGDDGYMFWKDNQESWNRLMDIDRYIDRTLPRDTRIPVRVPYSQRVGDPMANPIPYSQIPRVSLPKEKEIVVETKEPEKELVAAAVETVKAEMSATDYPSVEKIQSQSLEQRLANLRRGKERKRKAEEA